MEERRAVFFAHLTRANDGEPVAVNPLLVGTVAPSGTGARLFLPGDNGPLLVREHWHTVLDRLETAMAGGVR